MKISVQQSFIRPRVLPDYCAFAT